jgi:hypothetical protein
MKREAGWVATVRRRYRTLAIDVCLLFNLVVSFFNEFPFPFCKDQL